MSRRHLRFALPLVILLLCPTPAHADREGFWRWWDSLSGPGPFNGFGTEIQLYTLRREGGVHIEFDPSGETALLDPSAIKFGVQFGILKAEDNNLPYADGRAAPGVWAIPISVTADRGFKRRPGIEVGAGIGAVRFTGDGFGFWRATLSPRISIAPASLLTGDRSRRNDAFKIAVFITALLGEFDAGDFGATGDFKGGNELLFGTTFTIDVLALKKKP